MCTDAQFWHKHLLISLQDRDWAESMLDGRTSEQDIRVTVIALVAIDKSLYAALRNLGGMASPW